MSDRLVEGRDDDGDRRREAVLAVRGRARFCVTAGAERAAGRRGRRRARRPRPAATRGSSSSSARRASVAIRIRPRVSVPAVDRDLRLVSRKAGELGHGHEAEAARAERRHEALDRRDGLRAVAAAVVEQDDAAARALGRGRGDDRLDPGPAPVLAVEVGEHDVVAAAREPLERARLARGGRAARNGRVGRPEEARADARPSRRARCR